MKIELSKTGKWFEVERTAHYHKFLQVLREARIQQHGGRKIGEGAEGEERNLSGGGMNRLNQVVDGWVPLP